MKKCTVEKKELLKSFPMNSLLEGFDGENWANFGGEVCKDGPPKRAGDLCFNFRSLVSRPIDRTCRALSSRAGPLLLLRLLQVLFPSVGTLPAFVAIASSFAP